ncbi:MAG: hypothetical protein A4E39_01001 [Methanoregulaceae archaeon PtaB.Bin152]|nr:MAG: hypothetical protein A4E39_01001 [Methanoregulaceae archaeon PtaB.Bin152]
MCYLEGAPSPDLLKVRTDDPREPPEAGCTVLPFPVGGVARVVLLPDVAERQVCVRADGKLLRAHGGRKTAKGNTPDDRGNGRAEEPRVDKVAFLEPQEIGEAVEGRERSQRDDVGRGAPHVHEQAFRVTFMEKRSGRKPVGRGEGWNRGVVEPAVGAVEERFRKDLPDGPCDPGHALALGREAVRKLPAHHHCRFPARGLIATEHPGERGPFPQRAIDGVHTPVRCKFDVCAADIDPYHSRSTLPWLSNRALPRRCTSLGPPPLEAWTRISAISSCMHAAIPTMLVVIRGFTSTT